MDSILKKRVLVLLKTVLDWLMSTKILSLKNKKLSKKMIYQINQLGNNLKIQKDLTSITILRNYLTKIKKKTKIVF